MNKVGGLRDDTLIITSKGIYPIKELQNTFFEVRGVKNEWIRARCTKVARQYIYEITLNNNDKLYCNEHNIWRTIEDVKDMSIRGITTDQLKPQMQLPYMKVKKLFDSDVGTYTDGFCIGIMYCSPLLFIVNKIHPKSYGSSSYSDNLFIPTYTWAFEDKHQVEGILSQWLHSIDHCIIRSSKQNDNTVYNIQSQKINDYFEKFGLCKDEEVKNCDYGLPQICWCGSDDFRKGFINAIYSLTGVLAKPQALGYITNKSKKFIEELRILFGCYGVPTIIKNTGVLIFDMYSFDQIFEVSQRKKRTEIINLQMVKNAPDYVEVVECKKTELIDDVYHIEVYDRTNIFSTCYCLMG